MYWVKIENGQIVQTTIEPEDKENWEQKEGTLKDERD